MHPSDRARRLGEIPADPPQIRTALFLPCRNIATAAELIARPVDRCKTHPRRKTDPTFSAVAVYRGSWKQFEIEFAQTVQTSVAEGDAQL